MSYQQEKFKEIADKIREKTGNTESIKPSDFAALQDDVFEAGKKAEYDAFWDEYQEHGEKVDYECAFSGMSWNKNTFKPKYPLTQISAPYMMFYRSNIETIDEIEFAATSINATFRNSRLLKTIGKMKLADDIIATFNSTAFASCTSLQDITVEGTISSTIDLHWSPLTKKSVESIVSALSNDTTGLTVTFNQTQIEAIDSAEGGNWWTGIQKSNWTFALA